MSLELTVILKTSANLRAKKGDIGFLNLCKLLLMRLSLLKYFSVTRALFTLFSYFSTVDTLTLLFI